MCVTRRGEMWGIDGFAGSEVAEPPRRSTKVGEGLHEPLGLLPGRCPAPERLPRQAGAHPGRRWRSRVRDPGSIGHWWQISGNYHEYNFGPAPGIDGSYWITTNKPFGDQPFGRVEWRGYALRISADGEVKPMCAGLRSPAGVGTAPWGEVFYTDNQGEWCGASKLSLLSAGSYHGHPHGIGSTEDAAWTFRRPKALPDGETYADLAATGTSLAPDADGLVPVRRDGAEPRRLRVGRHGGRFGPFEGQVFVADQYEAAVFRVDLERVKGHWQGACLRFREGLPAAPSGSRGRRAARSSSGRRIADGARRAP